MSVNYKVYRNTTLGQTLQETLDEYVQGGHLTPHSASRILWQFDRSVNYALSNKVKTMLTFRAGQLKTYRFCDNVWTLVLEDTEFRNVQDLVKVDRVKIVACDARPGRVNRYDDHDG
ncbi:Transcription initiation factor IIA subunit 2, partial [Fragariocoptes setiger]